MSARKGWIVVLLLVFGLAGVGLIGLGIVLSKQAVQVKPATTLVLDFADPVLEDVPSGARSRLFFSESPTLWDHLRALDHAKSDPHVEAVLLRIRGADMGWAKTEELRAKLLEVQESGKRVVAYIEGGDDQDYVLASAADLVYMAPQTTLNLDGLASYEVFFKDGLDKLGVRANLEHIGEYKSAGEPFTRTSMSDAAREAANALLDQTWGEIRAAIADSRGLDSAAVTAILDNGPYNSRQAYEAGLVDSLLYPDELLDLLPGGEAGEQMAVDEYLKALPPLETLPGTATIAVVHASGTIVEGDSGTDPLWGVTVGSDTFADALDEALSEKGVRAVVLRVDSPGGEVYASHLMWRAVRQAAEEVPVVASFSDYAASGGYYVAMGADTILADAATLTGSIGVVGGKFNLGGLYDKLGIDVEVLARGRNAQLQSALRDFTPAERERYLSDMYEEYRTFVGIVADNRGAGEEEIDSVARGRVWTGQQAIERGLVDEIGGLEAAIGVARSMAGIGPGQKVRVESFPRVRRTFLQEFVARLMDEEEWSELARSAGTGPAARVTGWWRPQAELAASLARLTRTRFLAVLPFRIVVR